MTTILIFKSDTTKAVYSWNGSEVVIIVSAPNRPIGRVMRWFKRDIPVLQEAVVNNYDKFNVGEASYTVIEIINIP